MLPTPKDDDDTFKPPSTPFTPSSSSLNLQGYFSVPFERLRNDDNDWSGLTLLDTVETFFDARLDLFERKIKKQKERIQARATELARNRIRISQSDDLEKEIQKFKSKVSTRLINLTDAWHSAKVIRTREKITFFAGVMTVLCSALLFGLAPEWIPFVYTIQALYYIPLRFYVYKKKNYSYFLADLCYFGNLLALLYIWVFPQSPALFVASYCLAHGSLATAVITWRNSLVFHDGDKVISLFIHIYPPFTLTVIRHFYPNAAERFPALKGLTHLPPVRALLLSSLFYLLWQGLYWKLLLVDRRDKIKSGQRMTSFSYLLSDKRGPIGRMLRGVREEYREVGFMFGQFVYSIITELPAIFVLYKSPAWSGVFLLFIFGVSVWNGGGFYIEVFGRKFEHELEALRKELAQATAASQSHTSEGVPSSFASSSSTNSGRSSPDASHAPDYLTSSPVTADNSPIVGSHLRLESSDSLGVESMEDTSDELLTEDKKER